MYFVFPLCIFKPTFKLSEFKLFRCFSICFVVSLKRATSSVNLKLVRFSPSTLTPSLGTKYAAGPSVLLGQLKSLFS